MNAYYSRYGLNTYRETPYFQAHLPDRYELNAVLAKSRSFRRLPVNLKKLAVLSKQWAAAHGALDPYIDAYYDDDGYELNPETGKRLTDKEVDALWPAPNYKIRKFRIRDVPVPAGGFPDPNTWVEPEAKDDKTEERKKVLLEMTKDRGREYMAHETGVSLDGVSSDEDLVQKILDR